jgi:hypothetical protein
MKKLNKALIALFAVCLIASAAVAGNSGVVTSVREFTQSSGSVLKAATKATLDDIITQLDKVTPETGTATNAQAVVFEGTYTVAPVVLINSGNATNIAYPSSVTTAGFTANMKAGETNSYAVIAVQ